MKTKITDDDEELLTATMALDTIPIYSSGEACQLVQLNKPNELFDP
jgi:hypothetical protein